MRLYGEANGVPGLASGPIETRFARLRETCAADTLVVWTTPARWATGEGLSLRLPQLHLEFVCTLANGRLTAVKVAQVPEDARPPDREPGAVGVVVEAERILLPPEQAPIEQPDPGVAVLERHFARLAGQRWGGFVEPLRAALDAEAADDEARTQRLTVRFTEAALDHGGDEDAWRFKGIPPEALRQLDDGEWLEVLDDQGRSRTTARVIVTHPGQGTLIGGVRTSSDPPRSGGYIRPRSRKKILEQKRALLDELANPTGSLPNLVRLVATPSSMPTPRPVRPSRFVNPAVLRNRSQARAVSLALGLEDGEALLIQGPPGTGKSTTAAEIDVQLILRDPGVRILVCSHSNHGTDNMLMKVLPFLEDAEERIARIGYYERIARDARPYYAAPDADLGDRNVIFTTIDALILQDVAGARVYDYVILDEANRAGVLDSLLALARGKRMILVGDPMQLQPVMSEAEQQIVASANGRNGRRDRAVPVQPGGNHVIGKSLFAWIQERHFSPGAAVLLDQQNRMHPAIGELVSRVFYGSRVRTGPAAPRRGTGMTVLPSPMTWVDTRSLRGNVESRAGGTSLFNLAEARLVTSITRYVAAQAPPNLSIGIITAYAEQRDLLRRLMGPHDDWPPERQLEIDTVDAFEGREKDIIILSLVRANRRRDIGFLRLEQRLNVAVSRARRLLIVVGDTSTLRGGYFQHLIATAGSVGAIVPAPRLLGQLLHRTRKPRPERAEPAAVETADGVVVEAAAIGADGQAAGTNGSADGGFDFRSASAAGAAADASPPGAAAGSRRRRRRRALERLRERRAAAEAAQASDDAADQPSSAPEPAAALGALDAAGTAGATEGAATPLPPARAASAPSEARSPGESGVSAAQAAPDALARRPRARRRLARLALSASADVPDTVPTDSEPTGAVSESARADAESGNAADTARASATTADAAPVGRRRRRPAPAATPPGAGSIGAAPQLGVSDGATREDEAPGPAAEPGSLPSAAPVERAAQEAEAQWRASQAAPPSSAENAPARPRRGRRAAVAGASTAAETGAPNRATAGEPQSTALEVVPSPTVEPEPARPRGRRRASAATPEEAGDAARAAPAAAAATRGRRRVMATAQESGQIEGAPLLASQPVSGGTAYEAYEDAEEARAPEILTTEMGRSGRGRRRAVRTTPGSGEAETAPTLGSEPIATGAEPDAPLVRPDRATGPTAEADGAGGVPPGPAGPEGADSPAGVASGSARVARDVKAEPVDGEAEPPAPRRRTRRTLARDMDAGAGDV
ncbi:MAG: AAA family ATPase, partial [Chloroflexi bacterium]|nr:AAA family ATPase [Chloroflexota bacterium]